MPVVSRFYGFEIAMFQTLDRQAQLWPPYFHVTGNDKQAVIDIADGEVLDGRLGPRGREMIEEWRRQHIAALTQNWTLMSGNQAPNDIPPLD